jgi:CRP-like cAMP-binding protein
VGIPVFLGTTGAAAQAVCQLEGDAWRLPAALCRELSQRDQALRDLLQRYVPAYVDQISQSAACDRAHSPKERCARCLLMTHDRVEGDDFRLTQEYVASMIGVRRATASVLMSTLRQAGILRYTRGRVTVLDRAALESAACECYRRVKDGYDRLLAAAPSAG